MRKPTTNMTKRGLKKKEAEFAKGMAAHLGFDGDGLSLDEVLALEEGRTTEALRAAATIVGQPAPPNELGWEPVHERVPEGRSGDVVVEHIHVTREEALTSALRAKLNPQRLGFEFVPEGTYARLLVDGATMMTDTPAEHESNEVFLKAAHGDVLVFGLGLGCIIPPLRKNPRVTSITIVELSQDVLALVAPYWDTTYVPEVNPNLWVNPNRPILLIERDNAFTYDTSMLFNTIYFDIWADRNSHAEEGDALVARYARNLDPADPKPYIDYWYRKEGIEINAHYMAMRARIAASGAELFGGEDCMVHKICLAADETVDLPEKTSGQD